MSTRARSDHLMDAPDLSGLPPSIAALLFEMIERQADQVDAACLLQRYGNGGALKGVLVERRGSMTTVQLVDPDDDDRVTAGDVTYSVISFFDPLGRVR